MSQINKIQVLRPLMIFVIAFLAIFFILNFQVFAGFFGTKFQSKQSEDEQLTNKYRQLYGYENRPELLEQALKKTAEIYSKDQADARSLYASTNVKVPAANKNVALASEITDYISIPKLNISAPIVNEPSTDASKILRDLQSGVVLYSGSAKPGSGMSVIIGHSSSDNPWAKYGKVFASLYKLSKGDQIIINYGGKTYQYIVQDKITGSINDLSKANISGDLILGTCWPVGTDKERILVSATLQK